MSQHRQGCVSAGPDWLHPHVSVSDVLQNRSDWPNSSCELQWHVGKWHYCACSVGPLMWRSKTFFGMCPERAATLKWISCHLWSLGGLVWPWQAAQCILGEFVFLLSGQKVGVSAASLPTSKNNSHFRLSDHIVMVYASIKDFVFVHFCNDGH